MKKSYVFNELAFRNTYNLFGFPVNNVSIEDMKSLLRTDLDFRKPLIFSTINLNWVAESYRNENFRKAVCNSDIIVIDGKPLLWLSKLQGSPIKETVPGSTLIQTLNEEIHYKPVKIFLFGGEAEVADTAMKRINQNESSLHAVGAMNPGFGTVKEMSSNKIIDSINLSNPDILLVALGAKKGMEWIQYNKDKLSTVKVVSHLGASINFLAGSVKRAPEWMQNVGMEWAWRIMQEPKLIKRYWIDFWAICTIIFNDRKSFGDSA